MRLRKAWPRISDAGGPLVCFCCSCLCSSSARAALWSRLPKRTKSVGEAVTEPRFTYGGTYACTCARVRARSAGRGTRMLRHALAANWPMLATHRFCRKDAFGWCRESVTQSFSASRRRCLPSLMAWSSASRSSSCFVRVFVGTSTAPWLWISGLRNNHGYPGMKRGLVQPYRQGSPGREMVPLFV